MRFSIIYFSTSTKEKGDILAYSGF